MEVYQETESPTDKSARLYLFILILIIRQDQVLPHDSSFVC